MHSIKEDKADNMLEEVITSSNTDILGEDIIREHSYVGLNTKKIFYYHLTDHNYFLKRKPLKAVKPPARNNIKITELRAVYNCKSCGYRTMKREIFSKHTCKQPPIQNIACRNTYDQDKAPDGYEKCAQCTYFTRNKSSLKVHMRIHRKGTPYKCTECEYSGKDLKDLIVHYNNVKDLKCDCGFMTHVKQSMLNHSRSHTGEKPFSCGLCIFSTANRANLYRHSKIHK